MTLDEALNSGQAVVIGYPDAVKAVVAEWQAFRDNPWRCFGLGIAQRGKAQSSGGKG